MSATGLLALCTLVACSPSDPNPEPESAGTQALSKLITAEQYSNSLAYIFGPGIDAEVQFAPVAREEGVACKQSGYRWCKRWPGPNYPERGFQRGQAGDGR